MTEDVAPTPGRDVVMIGITDGRLRAVIGQCLATSAEEILLRIADIDATPVFASELFEDNSQQRPNSSLYTLGYIAGRTIWRWRGHVSNENNERRFRPVGRPTLAINREQISTQKTLQVYFVSLETKSENLAQRQQQSTYVSVSSPSLKPTNLTLYAESVRVATEMVVTRGTFVDLRVAMRRPGGTEIYPLLGKVEKLTPRPNHNLALISISFPDLATEQVWEDFLCTSWMTDGLEHFQPSAEQNGQ